jgi:hypothetical protein
VGGSSGRLQKLGIAGAGVIMLAAVAWGGTAAVSALLGRGDRTAPPIVADSAQRDTSMPAAADSMPDLSGGDVSRAATGVDSAASQREVAARETPVTSRVEAGTGGASAGGGASAATAEAARARDTTAGASGVTVDPARVLVLIRGAVPGAVATTENTVLAELLARKRPIVDPDIVAGIRADAAAMRALASGAESPAVAIGREYGAGTVVVGDLVADASEAVAGLITGTAVLTAKYYDVGTGRLFLSEKYQVGAGGVPGKAGVTVTDAVAQAAEAVARQMSRAILQKTGG